MRIATGSSTEKDANTALDDALGQLTEQLGGLPDLILVHATPNYPAEAVRARLAERAPGVPFHGGSTCMGVLTEGGFHSAWGRGLGLLGVGDPTGSYGVGAARIGGDPLAAAAEAARRALDQAGRPGEVPAMVLITSAAGQEERLLAGLEAFFGPNVVIAGGTSADELTGENAYQLSNDGAFKDAIGVAALFPSTEVMYSFHSGYEPTEHRGRATAVEGRVLLEIDGRPAGDVYDEWTGGLATASRDGDPAAHAQITLNPMGRVVGMAGGQPYYLLSHPQGQTEAAGAVLLTEMPQGEEVVLMHGDVDSLVTRGGRVVASALESAAAGPDEIAGALVIFCAGCMLTLYGRMDEVAADIRRALDGRPFLGVFSFGEQGCFVGGENRHGNLMICATLFGGGFERI